MTRQRSFKRLVRARMAKTGESYTAARAVLLAGRTTATEPGEKPWLATSDETIRDRTGRGWEEWFDLLDETGAPDKSHREIARWVADLLGIDPLAWNAQAVTMSYERTRRGRLAGEHEDGFTVTASRTVAAPPERVFDLLTDPSARRGWLADAPLTERTSTRPDSARFDWGDDGSRVAVALDPKDDGARCVVSVSHARLADAATADARKAWWRDRLAALRTLVDAGDVDG